MLSIEVCNRIFEPKDKCHESWQSEGGAIQGTKILEAPIKPEGMSWGWTLCKGREEDDDQAFVFAGVQDLAFQAPQLLWGGQARLEGC